MPAAGGARWNPMSQARASSETPASEATGAIACGKQMPMRWTASLCGMWRGQGS
jgi:hypothetical protein